MSKVYFGNLDPAMGERDLEDECLRFGRIYKLWVARNPPGFAFVDFEDHRDAEDCVRKLDGKNGWRVEISRSRGPGGPGGRGMGGRGRDMACFNCGETGHLARDCRAPRGGGGYRNSPPRRRSPSPYGGRGRSPYGGRDRSPFGGRGKSPYGGRDRSPYGERERSPYRARGGSPVRRDSPLRGRERSPY